MRGARGVEEMRKGRGMAVGRPPQEIVMRLGAVDGPGSVVSWAGALESSVEAGQGDLGSEVVLRTAMGAATVKQLWVRAW